MTARPKPTVLLRYTTDMAAARGWRKPWVRRAIGRWRSGAPFIVQTGPPRGLRHDPERTKAKRLAKRALQGKDRR